MIRSAITVWHSPIGFLRSGRGRCLGALILAVACADPDPTTGVDRHALAPQSTYYESDDCASSIATPNCGALSQAQQDELLDVMNRYFRTDTPECLDLYVRAVSMVFNGQVRAHDGINPGSYFYQPQETALNRNLFGGASPGDLYMTIAHETAHDRGIGTTPETDSSAELQAAICYNPSA